MDRSIARIQATQILDSRGNPTVRVELTLESGVRSQASVPSGASTGENEAVELRDGDKARYGGKGVLRACKNVEETIAPALLGCDVTLQNRLDRQLIELDGTANKSRLGANAILGVSMAIARAAAASLAVPLYSYLGAVGARRLPMPMMNVINGGKHADSSLDLQEFMIVPVGAPTFSEALRYCAETYHALRALLEEGQFSTSVGDEGGFAPKLRGHEAACELIVKAIERAGYRPGDDIALALDPAATSFYEHDSYNLARSREGRKSADEMIALYERWIATYPIVSIEDGLAESDWDGFRRMTAKLGARIQIVGDDNFVTNPKFIRRGIAERSANAALIKLNQIGTVSETVEAIELCHRAGWGYVVSHRSGETEDAFIADFAAAMGAAQMKSGAPCRGERIVKYNRLVEIERELGTGAIFGNPFKAL